ncbi:bifunctional TVP38/TMEM64 family protein/FAD-dependent oxidoreductase [Paracoccus sp. PARArs4]|uniref:FAD-dependent oxidoreductase n=1 Tax=Paracoccus sp. PARArs4 TaxID=2853442 RepID=UPI0024A69E59|nr:bifunctional TVP38/TMEM64 family protein/FAD-dependent oxidoreductase [Paracoccus sp. PARArs4]
MSRPLIFAALAVGVIAAAFLVPGDLLTLDGIRSQLDRVQTLRETSPVAVVAGFFLAYVAVTALSLPLAVWLTLAAGALFGFWQGLVIVSFASTIGASIAFLVARHLLRDWVRARFGDRLRRIEDGLERDGAFYLFSLRLIPVLPFVAVNLLMALTPMRLRTFAGISQLGMLAGTAVYVNAGTQLASLDSLSGIVSPRILASFAALAVFPWIAKAIVGIVRRRKQNSQWTKPKSFDRNLIVIGGGSAGLVTAYIAAATKAKVTLIEANEMGGDCLNTGCVPSKSLIRSAAVARTMRRADSYGIAPVEPQVDFRAVMERVHGAIATIAPHDSVERYEGLGVEVLQGRGRLTDPWTVEIAMNDGSTRKLTSRAIVIATGASPIVPPVPGLREAGVLTSDTMWGALRDRDRVPARMAILGGGPIGTELAQAFGRLGAQVFQVEMSDRILGREDPEVSELVTAALQDDGIEVLTGHKAVRAGRDDDGPWLEVEGPDGARTLRVDEIVAATGRAANLKGIGLEELGIGTDRTVDTNDYLQTIHPNILAAGDVAGPWQFTHTASHQAYYAAVNGLFGDIRASRVDDRVIPWATFTDPEIARLGLSETEARDQGVPYEVTRFDLSGSDRAIADGATRGFVKVLTRKGSDKIIGATIAGVHAGDLMAEFVLAMKHGLGLSKILGTIHIYPTLAEANKSVAGQWRRAHVNPRLTDIARRFHDWRRG